MTEPARQVVTATSTNAARSITVTCTDAGAITELHFEPAVYGHGARSLAAEILRLSQRSTLLAKARRRQLLADAGLAPVLLDRLGLPFPEAVDAQLAALEDQGTPEAPRGWVRAI
ncbi:hypothetical protein D7D52_35925 [Nocardia yunnanensis]|uniref:DUF2694 domain-containing protein n=1 Tax=Nocardia yunnanensis TaxID=2382165 RepID=A0A386ZNQ4_9NOCA|nr:hypothetical protein [Nocardia yunnanensis]AYF78329.1 hypothetical protein D7D52_35925 [Nocardia yunnanensis]